MNKYGNIDLIKHLPNKVKLIADLFILKMLRFHFFFLLLLNLIVIYKSKTKYIFFSYIQKKIILS